MAFLVSMYVPSMYCHGWAYLWVDRPRTSPVAPVSPRIDPPAIRGAEALR